MNNIAPRSILEALVKEGEKEVSVKKQVILSMTTPTIWRARCAKHGTEKRMPNGSLDSPETFLPCACWAKWQRWEVEEEQLWRVKDGVDLSHFFETKALAMEAMSRAGVAIMGDLTGPARVVRRILRRVKDGQT